MRIDAQPDVPILTGTWDTPVVVPLGNKLDTMATVSRILTERKIGADDESIALSQSVFYFQSGWVRVKSGWVHWSRSMTDEDNVVWMSCMKDPETKG